MLRIGCAVVLCLALPANAQIIRALSAASAATTRPTTPVEHFSATDQPLDLGGATGDMLRWLREFDLKPQQFEYTIQLLEDNPDDSVRLYRLVFPSPFKSPFAENNVVPCEFYVPKHARGKLQSAIVLDIMAGNAVVPRGLARGLAEQGVAALYMPMAYYNARRPRDRAHVRWLEDRPEHITDPPRQTIMDVRRAKAVLASRADIEPDQISITGVSLGGIMTSMAAGVDGHFCRVVPILAGGDLAALTFHAPETRRARQQLLDKGIDQQKLGEMMAPVEPLHFASRIDPKRCLMVNASRDEVIPRECTVKLWEAIGKPEILWVPSGHYSAAWFMPTIKQTAIDFLKGKSVTGLEL